jgi:hypothetical protein
MHEQSPLVSAYLEFEMASCWMLIILLTYFVSDQRAGTPVYVLLPSLLNLTHNLKAAMEHWTEVTNTYLLRVDPSTKDNILGPGTMMWFRRSTGQLCFEVGDSQDQDSAAYPWT